MTESEQVARYLVHRLGDGVAVESVGRSFPGLSRETWFVRTTAGAYVVRFDPPGGGICPVPLEREYRVYELLARTEVPVPKPLWFEEGAAELGGRPVMVREMVEGATSPQGIERDDDAGREARISAAAAHARTMAGVHTLDWRAAGFGDVLGAPDSPEEAARYELDTWMDTWSSLGAEPSPELRRLVRWLREDLPEPPERLSLLKGNNGINEEIWRDGRIVAMADWELAAIGDPTADWAFCQGVLDLAPRDATLRVYEEAAGFRISLESLGWYRLWTLAKVVINARAGLRGVLDGRDSRPTLIAFGLGTGTTAEHTLMRLMQSGSPRAAGRALLGAGG